MFWNKKKKEIHKQDLDKISIAEFNTNYLNDLIKDLAVVDIKIGYHIFPSDLSICYYVNVNRINKIYHTTDFDAVQHFIKMEYDHFYTKKYRKKNRMGKIKKRIAINF